MGETRCSGLRKVDRVKRWIPGVCSGSRSRCSYAGELGADEKRGSPMAAPSERRQGRSLEIFGIVTRTAESHAAR